jgi:ACS family glucarate transporter-like MFS transporter
MNTGAGVGGIIAPILTPWVASHFGWVSALSLAGAFSLIAALLWKFIGSPDLASAHVRSAVEEPA